MGREDVDSQILTSAIKNKLVSFPQLLSRFGTFILKSAICNCIRLLPASLWMLMCPAFIEAQPPSSRGSVLERDGELRNAPRAMQDRPFSRNNAQPIATPRVDARRISKPGRKISAPGERVEKKNDKGVSFGTTMIFLSLIVGLILVVAKLWLKHGPIVSAGLPPEVIEVLGKRNIDARQSIHLVRMGSRILVLGSSAEGLRTLSELTDPVEVDFIAGACRSRNHDNAVTQSFRALFKKQLPRDKSKTAAASRPATSAPVRPVAAERFELESTRHGETRLEEAHG